MTAHLPESPKITAQSQPQRGVAAFAETPGQRRPQVVDFRLEPLKPDMRLQPTPAGDHLLRQRHEEAGHAEHDRDDRPAQ